MTEVKLLLLVLVLLQSFETYGVWTMIKRSKVKTPGIKKESAATQVAKTRSRKPSAKA